MELTLVDTAGLREGGDAIEREGMRRARAELERADLALVVVDAREPTSGLDAIGPALDAVPQRIVVHNKADLLSTGKEEGEGVIRVSALTGQGMAELHAALRAVSFATGSETGGAFTARARHVDSLRRASHELMQARAALEAEALDLAAEALRHAHDALGEITGRVLPDDLLGHVFASFCIGK